MNFLSDNTAPVALEEANLVFVVLPRVLDARLKAVAPVTMGVQTRVLDSVPIKSWRALSPRLPRKRMKSTVSLNYAKIYYRDPDGPDRERFAVCFIRRPLCTP